MCGICGFIGNGHLSDLYKMNQAMTHRGPDAEGYWYDRDEGVYFGHKRLSIIDMSDGGQPMRASDQLIVSFNGEIYNHWELRLELEHKGYVFTSHHSDTEVLLHGYLEWGQNLPKKLNGMWAFAIYDRKKNNLFMSRDRFGKKPLFYSLQNGTFAFASELSSLIKHSHIPASISSKSLKKYFAYGFIPAPNSLYDKMYKLPGGYSLNLNVNTLEQNPIKYWEFVIEPLNSIPRNPEEEWGEQLRELLTKAVRRRLMSDVPLGVFLSGGIDSSMITAFAVKCAGNEKVKTFSIGFREKSFDESKFANRVSAIFKTDHHLKIHSLEENKYLLSEILLKLDEPMGDSSLLPTYLLCKEARKEVTVALGGDGGDELFAGYDPFKALGLAEFYAKIIPRPLHQAIKMMIAYLPVSNRNMSLDFKIKRTLRGLSYPKNMWNSVWLGTLEPKDLDELFQEPTNMEEVYSEAIEQWESCSQNNIVDKTLQFYTRLYLQDDILVKTDRASMMNSLEVRAPFLDKEVVDFVRRIPHVWKYRKGQTKYILKKALEPILPHNILYRSKKGFGVPVGKWMQQDLEMLPPSHSIDGLNSKFIEQMIHEHRIKKHDNRAFLWNLKVLCAK